MRNHSFYTNRNISSEQLQGAFGRALEQLEILSLHPKTKDVAYKKLLRAFNQMNAANWTAKDEKLYVWSAVEKGRKYTVLLNHEHKPYCNCAAAMNNQVCWHRAAFFILQQMEERKCS